MRSTIVLWSRIKLTTFELPYFHNTIVTLEVYYSIVRCNTFMTKFGPINIKLMVEQKSTINNFYKNTL